MFIYLYRKLFLIPSLLLTSLYAWAQPVASFTPDKLTGCSPVMINFTNNSSNATSFHWDFGNGNTSLGNQVSAFYAQPGIYKVSLIATQNSLHDTTSANIVVYASPTAGLSSSANNLCGKSPIQFTDQSIPNSANITEWFWSFGDGQFSSSQNPLHNYDAEGKFTVYLQVKDGNSCTASITKNNFIDVNQPKADFSTDTIICKIPTTLNFTNQSTGLNLSYQWNLGEGSTSTLSNPQKTYFNYDTIPVTLIVTSGNSGCVDSIKRNIRIGEYKVDYNYTVNCISKNQFTINFTNTSNPIGVTSKWDFGDNSTSSSINTSHTYNATGAYTISLTSTLNNYCKNTMVKTYQSPHAAFTYSNLPCKAPFKADFTNTSTGTALTYFWQFQGGQSSTLENPSHLFSAPPAYQTTSLRVTNTWGCTDADTTELYFPIPYADFSTDTPYTGCAPLTINFYDKSSSYLNNIKKTTWDFGDPLSGNNQSLLSNPNHVYTNTGKYDITLIAENDSGCIDTIIRTEYIKVGTKPSVAQFTTTADTVCYNSTYGFSDNSTYTDPSVQSNYWCWGWYENSSNLLGINGELPTSCPDSGFSDPNLDYSSVPNPLKKFNKYNAYDTTLVNGTLYIDSPSPVSGLYYVHMIVGNDGCYAETKKPVYIRNTMAMPSYIFPSGEFNLNSCSSPYYFGLFNGSSGYDQFNYLKVTNTQTNQVIANVPDHDTAYINLTKAGVYRIDVDVSNIADQCNDMAYKTIVIDSFVSNTIMPKKACINELVKIKDKSISNFGQIVNYFYLFGDGSSVGHNIDSTAHVYEDTGTFVIKTIVTTLITNNTGNGISYCDHERYDTIRVEGIQAEIFAENKNFCPGENIQFSDSSFSSKSVTYRKWYFGDNQTSTVQDPVHSYSDKGTYSVRYSIKNASCADSINLTNYINVVKPIADFSAVKSILCEGDSTKFLNASSPDGLIYHWDFGQGDTANTKHPKATYLTENLYTVELTVMDSDGCKDTVTKVNMIDVAAYPIVDFTVSDTVSDCAPYLASFTDQSTKNIDTWDWTFETNATSTNKNPFHNYTFPGKYDVTLKVTNTNHCSSTLTKSNYITVHGPHGTYIASPDSGCSPLNVLFDLDFYETKYHTWDFGDGSVANNLYADVPDSIYHVYSNKGIITPYVVLLDSNNCSSTLSTGNIFLEDLHANFGLSDSLLCSFSALKIHDSTQHVFPITYNWSFGDNESSTNQNPTHLYTSENSFNVQLIVKSPMGCSDTLSKQIQVFKAPSLLIDTITASFCVPFNAEFNVVSTDPNVTINKLFWKYNADQQDSTYAKFLMTIVGSHSFHLVVQYAGNLCTIDSVITLQALLAPTAQFTFSPEHPSVNTIITLNNESQNASSFLWDYKDNSTGTEISPEHTFTKKGNYDVQLIAANSANCFDTTHTLVNIAKEDFVKVVSGFTPNGDGINDYVKILNGGEVSLVEFTIYNRWGQLVFRSNDINSYWDGTFNGSLQDAGTFVYYVTAKNNKTQQVLTEKGNITLLR